MKRSARLDLNRCGRWVGLGCLCWVVGCATQTKRGAGDFIVFPPPPDEPRIQFLTGFGWESDLGGQSQFSKFVLGREQFARPIWKPYGIFATPGKLHVCDTGPGNVSTVELDRKRIRYLRPAGQGAMQVPINIAVDRDGTRYVTDTSRCQVLIYGPEDQFLGAIGKLGEMKPCGIALTADRLIVTDLSNHCVRVYSKATREMLFTVPAAGADEAGKLLSPTNVAVDQEGRMYVSDTGGFNVKVYDAEGKHLRSFGDLGLSPGQFALPKGIGVDREKRVYVVDGATGVVQLFDSEGRLLLFFGHPNSSGRASTYLPAGLAIDYENVNYFQQFVAPGFQIEYLIYITNQAGDKKVSVYGFLRK